MLGCSLAGHTQLSLTKQVVMSAEHAHVISEAAAASQICTLQVLACLTNESPAFSSTRSQAPSPSAQHV